MSQLCLTGSASWVGRVPYRDGLRMMAAAHAEVADGRSSCQILYLEHDPVITYGRATTAEEVNLNNHQIPTVAVPRGGLATWHGPNQIVGYLMLNLRDRDNGQEADIHQYLRGIEEGLIQFVKHEFHLAACRRPAFTGVWTPGFGSDASTGMRKLASIGVSARRWVTSHGFALNICPDMTGFGSIVPCGIRDAEMTSIEAEFERAKKPYDFQPLHHYIPALHRHMTTALATYGWSRLPELSNSKESAN